MEDPAKYPRILREFKFPFSYNCESTDRAAGPNIVLPAKALIVVMQVIMLKGNWLVQLHKETNNSALAGARIKAVAHVLRWFKAQFDVVKQNSSKYCTGLQTQLRTCHMQAVMKQISRCAAAIHTVFEWQAFDDIMTEIHDIDSAVLAIGRQEARCDSLLDCLLDSKKNAKLDPRVTVMYPPAVINELAAQQAKIYEKWWRDKEAMKRFGVEEDHIIVKKEDGGGFDEVDMDEEALGVPNSVVDCNLDIITGAADLAAVPPDIGSCPCCKKKILQFVICAECKAVYHVVCAVKASKVQTLLKNQTWCCPKCDPSLLFTPLDDHAGLEDLGSDVIHCGPMLQDVVQEMSAREKDLRKKNELVIAMCEENDKTIARMATVIQSLLDRLQERGESAASVQQYQAAVVTIKEEHVGKKRKALDSLEQPVVIDDDGEDAGLVPSGSAAGGSGGSGSGGGGGSGSGGAGKLAKKPKPSSSKPRICAQCFVEETKGDFQELNQKNKPVVCPSCFDNDVIFGSMFRT